MKKKGKRKTNEKEIPRYCRPSDSLCMVDKDKDNSLCMVDKDPFFILKREDATKNGGKLEETNVVVCLPISSMTFVHGKRTVVPLFLTIFLFIWFSQTT